MLCSGRSGQVLRGPSSGISLAAFGQPTRSVARRCTKLRITCSKLAPNSISPSYRVFGLTIPAEAEHGQDDFSVHPALVRALEKKLGCRRPGSIPAACVQLVRKSFDARKPKKTWVYVVDVPGEALATAGIRVREKAGQVQQLSEGSAEEAAGDLVLGNALPHQATHALRDERVVVVGSGPAGLFAALAMAEAGIPVTLLERGQPVEVRGRDIGRLCVRREASPNSNFCFGEGGAGTFSDGKLTTRIGRNSDPVRRVLEVLVRLGAPPSILVSGKPHLGTDRLVRLLRAFRQHLTSLGVDIRFGAVVSRLQVQREGVTGVQLSDGQEIPASRVVLAVGHSAREMYQHLTELEVAMTPKPFAMGFRIEHPQALIDRIQYGEHDAAQVLRGKGPLPVADYRLATTIQPGSDSADSRGIFSFCQCPGGQIVWTGTDASELCINGMSFSRRNSLWANSALVVTVGEADWAHHLPQHGVLAAVELQRQIEREAARRGGGNLTVPVQRALDFMEERPSTGVLPSSSYRLGVAAAPLHNLYTPEMTAAFREALLRFDRQMPGFLSDQALLHGAETRTSAPVRVERDPSSLESPSLARLYPCGEGAGYAGGIMSAAVDGLHVGLSIVSQVTGCSELSEQSTFYRVTDSY